MRGNLTIASLKMVKVKDARPLTIQERIAEQKQQFNNYTEIQYIQDKSIHQITIDGYSLSNFTALCREITSSLSLLHIEVQIKLDTGYLNELHSCMRDNRTLISLKFSEPAYIPDIPFNFHKFFQRNLALPKIVKFIIETSKDGIINSKDINPTTYSFLKYCLPFNKGEIEKGLCSANFKGTYNMNHVVHEPFVYNLVCKDIKKYGGLFATLPIEAHNLIFNSLEDHGVPCIGTQYAAADV